jgi:hypothetical protein
VKTDQDKNDSQSSPGHTTGDSLTSPGQDRNDSQQHIEDIRPGLELQAVVLQSPCHRCWAYRNRPCKLFKQGDELHIARYEFAKKTSLITESELEAAKLRVGEGGYVIWEEESA